MKKSMDLIKLSEILDEHIAKGRAVERRTKSKVEAYEEEICKALSFDPFSPAHVDEQSQFYNPYMQHQSGGFMPYPDSYWAEQSDGRPRPASGYETVREFYSIVNDRDPANPRAIHPLFQGPLPPQVPLEAQSRFAQFRKSHIDFVFKGKPVPVGTVHTGPDGQRYKKMSEGKWAPVATAEHRKFVKDAQNPKSQNKVASQLESSASQRYGLTDAIERKQRDQKVIDEAKNQAVRAAAEHTHKMVSSLYDGKPPKQFDQAHKEHLKQYGSDEKTRGGTRKLLHQVSANMKPKHHAVEVSFTHNGQDYTHRFPQVEAGNHTEAIDRVSQILKEKLPGSTLNRIHAEIPKEKPKAEPKDEANA